MKASVKRIIWTLGWYFIWILEDFRIYYTYGLNGLTDEYYQTLMFFIWIIPLFLFTDDKEKIDNYTFERSMDKQGRRRTEIKWW